MSLESVEELESLPSNETEGAPPPRRRSLSKLRRRLSRTFRLSFSGSLTDFAQTFSIAENAAEQDGVLEEDGEEGLTSRGATSKSNGKTTPLTELRAHYRSLLTPTTFCSSFLKSLNNKDVHDPNKIE